MDTGSEGTRIKNSFLCFLFCVKKVIDWDGLFSKLGPLKKSRSVHSVWMWRGSVVSCCSHRRVGWKASWSHMFNFHFYCLHIIFPCLCIPSGEFRSFLTLDQWIPRTVVKMLTLLCLPLPIVIIHHMNSLVSTTFPSFTLLQNSHCPERFKAACFHCLKKTLLIR